MVFNIFIKIYKIFKIYCLIFLMNIIFFHYNCFHSLLLNC